MSIMTRWRASERVISYFGNFNVHSTKISSAAEHKDYVRGALLEFEPIWNELFPAEQARIVELLVDVSTCNPTASTCVCGLKG